MFSMITAERAGTSSDPLLQRPQCIVYRGQTILCAARRVGLAICGAVCRDTGRTLLGYRKIRSADRARGHAGNRAGALLTHPHFQVRGGSLEPVLHSTAGSIVGGVPQMLQKSNGDTFSRQPHASCATPS
jgi:hypothetical protein